MAETKIDKIIKQCLGDNLFGDEDIVEAKTVLTWLFRGKKSANKISPQAVRNLEECGFVEGDKLSCGIVDDLGIWFCLAIAGAKGFIKQTTGVK